MIALRIDDLGASSKLYERHRGKLFPYRELTADELAQLTTWLIRTESRCTLAITACWVTRGLTYWPYAAKFPAQTAVIKDAVRRGLVEVACHGLTHCIPGKHADWKFWRSNRQWHREFTDAMPWEQQVQDLRMARAQLEETFETDVTTLVPPGNMISERLALTALDMGFQLVTCRAPRSEWGAIIPSVVYDDAGQLVAHDRDLVRCGVAQWLSLALAHTLAGEKTCTVREWVGVTPQVIP